MSAVGCRPTVVLLLFVSAACADWGPSPLEGPGQAPPPPAVPDRPDFPPPSGASRSFAFARNLSYPVREYTTKSRFVLYDNGAFVLEYAGLGEYRGGYTRSDGVLAFEWEGWSTAGPWGATGTLVGDSLRVEYNTVMQLSDFEDAVYALVR